MAVITLSLLSVLALSHPSFVAGQVLRNHPRAQDFGNGGAAVAPPATPPSSPAPASGSRPIVNLTYAQYQGAIVVGVDRTCFYALEPIHARLTPRSFAEREPCQLSRRSIWPESKWNVTIRPPKSATHHDSRSAGQFGRHVLPIVTQVAGQHGQRRCFDTNDKRRSNASGCARIGRLLVS